MRKDNLIASNIDELLQKLYDEILNTVDGMSSIELSNLNHPYQDARLVSVKGPKMDDYKSSGGAFLGKETNPKHLNLPNGEYVHIDEFVTALNQYYINNRRRQYIIESEDDKQVRKISKEKLGEFKSFVAHATALQLDQISKVTNQDARLVRARSSENPEYFKSIGGAFLGSEKNNIKRNYPSQLLPKDQSNYINKDELIKALDNIFKETKNWAITALPSLVPIMQTVTPTQIVAHTETVQQQDVEKEVSVEVDKYSDSLVIGDVLNLQEGEKFYHDSWESPAIGEVGEIYSPQGNYTVNSFVVRNSENGYYKQYTEENQQLTEAINELKKEGKITNDNYVVYYHVGLGEYFAIVGEGADRGWKKYDENSYPVEKRASIGKEQQIKTYTQTEEVKVSETKYFYAELKDVSVPKMFIDAEIDGEIITLKNKNGDYIDFSKLSEGKEITLVDEMGIEYKIDSDDITYENGKYKLRFLIPIIIPLVLTKKDKKEEDEQKSGGKTR